MPVAALLVEGGREAEEEVGVAQQEEGRDSDEAGGEDGVEMSSKTRAVV